MPAIETAGLQPWLAALQVLLEPLRPQRLALVHGLVLPPRLQWVDQLTDDALAIEPDDDALRHCSGWVFPLDPRSSEPTHLFVATDSDQSRPDPLMQAATGLCRAAWRLRQGEHALGDDDARALGESIHGLRNGLNSVLMSAAVITTCADLLPERLQPIAREIESAAQRSVERLHRLTALIEPGR